MATRAGVEEYSTSPRPQRSSERSIRASWTTGYWGATSSIRASISTRFVTTAETIDRASSPAAGSASTSASWRSRTAVGVRCPKSASNTAVRATRRPARNERMRSPALMPRDRSGAPAAAAHAAAADALGADAVDEHGDGPNLEPEEPFHGAPDRLAHLAAGMDEVCSRPGDDAELDLDALLPAADDDRRSGQRCTPRWPPPRDLEDRGDLERREPGDLGDHAAADGQLERRLGWWADRRRVDDERVVLLLRCGKVVGHEAVAARSAS